MLINKLLINMNVLETANILLDYYNPDMVESGIIINNKLNDPNFIYNINNITYRLYFNHIFDTESDIIPGNDLRIAVCNDSLHTIRFEYTCNEIERLDILKKMDKVSKDWYNNYVEKIKVPIPNNNIDPVIEMKGVEVTAPSDLV